MQILVQALTTEVGVEGKKPGELLQDSKSGDTLFAELLSPEFDGETEIASATEVEWTQIPSQLVTNRAVAQDSSIETVPQAFAEMTIEVVEGEAGPEQELGSDLEAIALVAGVPEDVAVQQSGLPASQGLEAPPIPLESYQGLPAKSGEPVVEQVVSPRSPEDQKSPLLAQQIIRQQWFGNSPSEQLALNDDKKAERPSVSSLSVAPDKTALDGNGRPFDRSNLPLGVTGKSGLVGSSSDRSPKPAQVSENDRLAGLIRETASSPIAQAAQPSETVPRQLGLQMEVPLKGREDRIDARYRREVVPTPTVAPSLQMPSVAGSNSLATPAATTFEAFTKSGAGLARDSAITTSELGPGLSAPGQTEDFKPQASTVPRLEALARPVMQQVQQLVLRSSLDGIIEVKLSPEELGRVRLAMSQVEAGVAVHITAERSETLELMRRNIDMLEADLRGQGFENLSFSFGQDGQRDHPANEQQPAKTERAEVGLQAEVVVKPAIARDGRVDIRL